MRRYVQISSSVTVSSNILEKGLPGFDYYSAIDASRFPDPGYQATTLDFLRLK